MIDILGTVTNIVLVALILACIVLLIETIDNHKRMQRMYGVDTSYMRGKDLVLKNKFFSNFYNLIEGVCIENEKEKYVKTYYYGSLIMAIVMLLYFIVIKQVLFAIGVPVVTILSIKKIFELLRTDATEKIEEQLPAVIDNIVKIFSRYSDLKTVIYEVSLLVEDPIKGKLDKLARKMLSEDHSKTMMDFADDIDNIWVYSMVFILLSYKEETKKEDVILNLRHLSSIIEKENSLKNASVTDKKYGVMLNYAVAFIGGAGGIANIMFNPSGKSFFFGSVGGILCIIIGYASIIFTVFINIKLNSKKRRGKK